MRRRYRRNHAPPHAHRRVRVGRRLGGRRRGLRRADQRPGRPGPRDRADQPRAGRRAVAGVLRGRPERGPGAGARGAGERGAGAARAAHRAPSPYVAPPLAPAASLGPPSFRIHRYRGSSVAELTNISLARGAPSLDIVAVDDLRAAADRAFQRDPGGMCAYGTSPGYTRLLEWLAKKHVVAPDRLIATNGSMQADAFLFDNVIEPGDLLG